MPTPVTYKILYNNHNITEDVSQYATSLTYTDKTEKEADEISIELEDSDQRWQNEWYPEKGASLYAEIIQGKNVLKCGTFQLDEISLAGDKSSGDMITLKGLSAGIKKKLRTKKSFANENKTLREIANTVAAANGLTLQGTVPDVKLDRVTQWRETDLAFLNRIGQQYGALFSVRGDNLIFTNIFDIEKSKAVMTVDKTRLLSYNLSDKSFLTFKDARIRYHHPAQKKVITYTAQETATHVDTVKEDTLELHVKAENDGQAQIKAKVALYRANSLQLGGSITLPGNVLLIAGNNIELTGLGRMSGKIHLTQTEHTITKSGGYDVSADVKRVALIAAEKQKSKAKDNAVSIYPEDQNDTNE